MVDGARHEDPSRGERATSDFQPKSPQKTAAYAGCFNCTTLCSV